MKNILSQNAFWIVNKSIARAAGLDASLLLSDLVTKQEFFGTEWFFNTANNIEEDTTLTPHQQRKAIKVLIGMGFIETDLKGLPAKLHFKVVNNKLLNFLTTSNEKTSQLYNKNTINNNKINNINTPEFEKKSNIGEEEKISTTKRSEASPKNKKKENNPPLPPDPPNKEKKPKTNPLFQSFKQSFIDKYESISGQEFYWRAKDSVAINSLITQTKFAYTTSGTPQPTDEQMLDGINAILNRALTDPWMKDNFEPSIISSKFNILKSKYYGKRQTGISEADIDRIVNEFNSD